MCGLSVCLCSTDRKDFSDDPLNVTFAAGSVVSSYASVGITDDNIMEENETFICVILKSTQFEKDDLLTEDPDVATIAILDSDRKCELNIQKGYTGAAVHVFVYLLQVQVTCTYIDLVSCQSLSTS